jgi:hypothetical protein
MREYVSQYQDNPEYDAWFRRKVDIAFKAADEGHYVGHEEIRADIKARRARANSL